MTLFEAGLEYAVKEVIENWGYRRGRMHTKIQNDECMVTLRRAIQGKLFGGKASALSKLLNAGIPVPEGVAFYWGAVTSVLYDSFAIESVLRIFSPRAAYPLALRSSVVGEDGATSSFAGRYESVLNLYTHSDIYHAWGTVRASADKARAVAYRTKMGITDEPEVAVILQRMIIPTHAAVAFTRDPMTEEKKLIIEVVPGTGDALVSGRRRPATYETDGGRLQRVSGPLVTLPRWRELAGLARKCEDVIERPADVEAAFDGEKWYILQARPITTGAA